jgi:hypothetical protein
MTGHAISVALRALKPGKLECTGVFHTGNPTARDISLPGDWLVRCPELLSRSCGTAGERRLLQVTNCWMQRLPDRGG